MSIFFDPRKRKPRAWTFVIFILITLGIVSGFLFYGKQRADEREREIKNQQAEPNF
jgi:hypothetical protein